MGLRESFQSPAVRRLVGLALLCSLLILGGRLLVRGPVTVDGVYELGPEARGVGGLVVTYRLAGADGGTGPMALRKRYNYGREGAPSEEHHRVRLAPGTYDLEIVVERPAGPETFTRRVEIHGDGAVMRVRASR
jgi:hypothetical protein